MPYSLAAVKKNGSLRNIELKRNGRLVTVLGLYDLLLHVDTSAAWKLMPGDVIFYSAHRENCVSGRGRTQVCYSRTQGPEERFGSRCGRGEVYAGCRRKNAAIRANSIATVSVENFTVKLHLIKQNLVCESFMRPYRCNINARSKAPASTSMLDWPALNI